MSLLIGTGLAKAFGAVDIFTAVAVSLPHGARVALVGPNGSGKTTLLRVLAGLDEPTQGTVQRARGVRVGYLPQEASFDAGVAEHTLWQEMLTPFAALRAAEAELRQLEARLAQAPRPDHAALLEKYGQLQHQFEAAGGYAYEPKIQRVLAGLGFTPEEHGRPLRQLSGGQKTRALLGRLLLEEPDLLILDEPTNHLDIEAVEWLEAWLGEWRGAALIVSHDRYFMDRVAEHIWALDPAPGGGPAQLAEYRGNYSAYLLQRDERRARQLAEFEAQQAFISKELDFIRRNMAGQNTRQAKGRLRRLERLMSAPAEMARRPAESQTIKLRLVSDLRSGDRVAETHGLAVGYQDDGRVLFEVPDLLLWRGECAALIGPNGAGKTTFLKTLLGQVPPLAGRVKLGSSLKIGYFAQAHEGLHPERTVLEEIRTAQDMAPGQARDYLGKFLFSGDDVFKTVSVLSGGERGRLALAKLALSGANLLLLDEPTNHLDIPSQEILEAVLDEFDGTILLVSHDRYLIDDLATQIWVVDPDDGQLRVFAGSWSEYAAWREGAALTAPGPSPKTPADGPRPKGERPAEKAAEAAPARLSKNEAQKRAARIAELEAQIDALEKRKAEVSRELDRPGLAVGRASELGAEYARLEAEIAARLDDWAELAG
ncbi:MAG: ABC-F family ATP-binding cassette domain-containing protein [Anaerolineales bacterium]|nr:ABC-F family ATP-binding cassette domain-containing protein [Anaerolineales bacterium]